MDLDSSNTSPSATHDPNPSQDPSHHHDEAHPLSERTSETSTHKLSTTLAALTDPKFPLPTLTSKSSISRYILSFSTLITLTTIGVVGARYLGAEMLQSSPTSLFLPSSSAWQSSIFVVGSAVTGILALLYITGTVWIDWFELVVGYWWLSLPVGALAGLVIVMGQESTAPMGETA